ncbi:VOC family protein [Pseudalkalibacillus sp. Hm43]|uniref:VOC family protein n=1 Tax=Pseudalkalibacillus sp. Hm43 TaxID=3450742 RepID=UPI003F424415
MKQTIPYLVFNGQAKEALEYYKDIFGGEVTDLQTFGEADFPTPPEADEMVLHARFKKGDLFFMVSDTFPGQEVERGTNISLTLEMESEEQIQSLYEKLSEKGKVAMELQDMFWGAKYAKVVDAYGFTWDLNYPTE